MDTIPGIGVYCPSQTMRCRSWLPTLALSALIVTASLTPVALAEEGSASSTVVTPAPIDAGAEAPVAAAGSGSSAGSGSGSAVAPSESTTKVTTTVTVESGDETLMKTLYDGIRSKDWFLVIGAALALLIHGARWLLAKKWPKFEQDRYGYFLAAAIAGFIALSTAWLSGVGGAATAESWIGGLKLFAAASLAYVTAKKAVGAPTLPTDEVADNGSLTSKL